MDLFQNRPGAARVVDINDIGDMGEFIPHREAVRDNVTMIPDMTRYWGTTAALQIFQPRFLEWFKGLPRGRPICLERDYKVLIISTPDPRIPDINCGGPNCILHPDVSKINFDRDIDDALEEFVLGLPETGNAKFVYEKFRGPKDSYNYYRYISMSELPKKAKSSSRGSKRHRSSRRKVDKRSLSPRESNEKRPENSGRRDRSEGRPPRDARAASPQQNSTNDCRFYIMKGHQSNGALSEEYPMRSPPSSSLHRSNRYELRSQDSPSSSSSGKAVFYTLREYKKNTCSQGYPIAPPSSSRVHEPIRTGLRSQSGPSQHNFSASNDKRGKEYIYQPQVPRRHSPTPSLTGGRGFITLKEHKDKDTSSQLCFPTKTPYSSRGHEGTRSGLRSQSVVGPNPNDFRTSPPRSSPSREHRPVATPDFYTIRENAQSSNRGGRASSSPPPRRRRHKVSHWANGVPVYASESE